MRVMSLYTGQTQPNNISRASKPTSTASYYYQSNDTTHFSGKDKGQSSTVVARGSQSKLYTAANDVRPDAFVEELSQTTDNPNEIVAGDTTTLQALLTNHESYAQRNISTVSTTKQMLIAFFEHPQVQLLNQDEKLVHLTNRILKLNDREILDAFTRIPEFDIKKLETKLQKKIWAGLT